MTNKNNKFFVPKAGEEIAKKVLPELPIEAVEPENWQTCITDPNAIVVCGPWPMPFALDAILRLCSNCGAEIGVSPQSINATRVICMDCGRDIIEAQNERE